MKTSPIWGHAPHWTYQNQIWHNGSCGRCNHLFQILSKWLRGFRAVRDQKWGFPIDLDSRPYNRSPLWCACDKTKLPLVNVSDVNAVQVVVQLRWNWASTYETILAQLPAKSSCWLAAWQRLWRWYHGSCVTTQALMLRTFSTNSDRSTHKVWSALQSCHVVVQLHVAEVVDILQLFWW